MPYTFALNRTCAPQLGLQDFVDLAASAGVTAIEIRNDLEGREFMDGTPPERVLGCLEEAGMQVASVNALQRFNDWSQDRAREAKTVTAYAAALGAPGIVLCPVHNADHGWSEAEAERNLRDGLRRLRPILSEFGVKGYVEPLGMAGSTMKTQSMAVAAIADIDGWDIFALCYDTFQFFRCGDDRIFADKIALAHMSGISRRDLSPSHLTEPDRGLVEEHDRVDNIGQLKSLIQSGYDGYISMEPFSPAVQHSSELPLRLSKSFALVSSALDQR